MKHGTSSADILTVDLDFQRGLLARVLVRIVGQNVAGDGLVFLDVCGVIQRNRVEAETQAIKEYIATA